MNDMAQRIVPAPVRKSIRVNASPARAFEVFTAQMGVWWPRSHSVNAAPMADVVIEPHAGGKWFERGADGSIALWGEVLNWDPPRRVLLAWRLDGDWTYRAEQTTEVDVRFTPDGDGVVVTLEHRGLEAYGDAVDGARAALDGDNGWGGLLARFAACERGAAV